MIEGGGSKNFENIKSLMYQNPVLMHSLLAKITSAVVEYLSLKIEHGAALVQIFDTWASALDRDDYTKFALPYQEQIISALHKRHPETKITLYVNGVSNIFDLMVASGADVISIDWRIDLAEAFRQLKKLSGSRTISLQGNLDPCFLLGSPELIVSKTTAMLEAAKAGIDAQHGYIANLGHGIIPQVPVPNAKLFIDTVHKFNY
jgi:uroporphyrinogen decarboxylase